MRSRLRIRYSLRHIAPQSQHKIHHIRSPGLDVVLCTVKRFRRKGPGVPPPLQNRSVRGREEKRGYFRSEEEKRREVILFHNFTSKQVKPLFVTYFPLVFSLVFCAHFSLGWLTVNCGRAGSAASKPHIFNSPALSASAR